ncbi:MAG: hypothetical protein AAF570_20305 [Bacteroidota bacterium]
MKVIAELVEYFEHRNMLDANDMLYLEQEGLYQKDYPTYYIEDDVDLWEEEPDFDWEVEQALEKRAGGKKRKARRGGGQKRRPLNRRPAHAEANRAEKKPATMTESRYHLSELAIWRLRRAGMSRRIAEALAPLVGQRFENSHALMEQVRQLLDEDTAERWRALLTAFSFESRQKPRRHLYEERDYGPLNMTAWYRLRRTPGVIEREGRLWYLLESGQKIQLTDHNKRLIYKL